MHHNQICARLLLFVAIAWASTIFWTPRTFATPVPGMYRVTDYGAVPDGKTLNTIALQKAIDACAEHGGGIVFFPPGKYLTGTLFFRNHVTFHLEAGAVLLGSTNLKDYPPRTPKFRSYTDVKYVDKSLIYAERVHDVAIVGRGTINGQGGAEAFKGKPNKKRPYLIRMIQCQNVLLRDITLRDSPMWIQHYLACDNVHIDGLTIHSTVNRNNDGIDIDGCERVRIANCDIVSGDDAIVLKSTSPRPCRRITVTNCTLCSNCNALKCGTESTGGFEDITISNCTIYDTHLSGIALELVDGGTFDRVLVSNITMTNTHSAIFIRLGNRARPYLPEKSATPIAEPTPQLLALQPDVGSMRNVMITNIAATGVDQIGCAIAGLPDHAIENVTLQNICITYVGGGKYQTDRIVPERESRYPEYTMFGTLPAYGFYCRHIRNLSFNNFQLDYVEPEQRPALICDDVTGLSLEAFQAKPSTTGDTIRLVGSSTAGKRDDTSKNK